MQSGIVSLFLLALLGVTFGISGPHGMEVQIADENDESGIKFRAFKSEYNKTYLNAEEENIRFSNFLNSLKIADRLNSLELGSATYGVTKFSDLTAKEFRVQFLMPDWNVVPTLPKESIILLNTSIVSVPSDFDWRSKGAVTSVKNQGQCGSCWAFSATETVESYHKLSGHNLVDLSPQQIVSCDHTCQGCGGGLPSRAYEYIISAGGLDSEASFPYTASNGQCHNGHVEAKIKKWGSVSNEEQMLAWVASKGPLSVCVDAETWQHYTGGIVKQCGKAIDHCVQVTGYGPVDGERVWHVRNSWGTDWGLGGYIHIAYGDNVCGIASVPTWVDV